MRHWHGLAAALAAQRGHLFAWVPVALGIGIGLYFALPVEPAPSFVAAAAVICFGLLAALRLLPEDLRPLAWLVVLVLAGVALAAVRASAVSAPVLGYRYYGPVQGRVIHVDRSQSDAVRVTLDRVVLARMDPARTPARVRISLHGTQGFVTPEPGMTLIMTAHLSPPSGPVEPGGFDFQRQAWFQRLGAVGYTRTPALLLAPAEPGAPLWVSRLRARISAAVQASLPGEVGAFAAAVTTGDRSGITRETAEALRRSNLAHLLAISGLHMGLATGFIYASLRYGLALWPALALRWPVRKIAALVALGAGAGYLALSGGNVATERAYVMVAVALVAVLLDRRALTLRAVAVAALVVLVLRPETLTGPGFQMSFAATTALVAVFGALRDWTGPSPPRWLRPVLAVVLSSAVAGLATAPVAAAHFNRIADYGLMANLLAVPLMGLVVMPGAVLAALLAPLGLGWIGLALMQPAIAWILGVAHHVASMDGSVTHVVAPPGVVLPLMALGALWVMLWQGRWPARAAGAALVLAGLVIWSGAERPALLIADTGRLVGLMTEDGRALSKLRGDGFSARSWLENDGDGADQPQAALRKGFGGEKGALRFDLGGRSFVLVSGRGATARAQEFCRKVDVVVVGTEVAARGPCQLYDATALRRDGAVAVFKRDNGLSVVSVRQTVGKRWWNQAAWRRAGR